ncbi:MAG: type I methionyl aminopeptidase [Burkholderiaceae bacterium]|nr:type I methionyl aminopeptidase [Burkholderiaceae bacterium]
MLGSKIVIKTKDEIEQMRLACRDSALVLDYIAPFVKAGVTTEYLDTLMLRYIEDELGDISACLGYNPGGGTPYPKATCISVNHQICHGIPDGKILKNGDILNIDVTVIRNGFHGDTSRMFMVGNCSIAAKHLVNVTFDAMWKGIEVVRPGAHIGDIGHVIQHFAEPKGCSIVREFCGHGIGRGFHEEPQVCHYGKMGTGEVMKPGMIFTIEPMINAGRKELRILPNGWTAVTKDRSLSAQWEHTVLVTETGYEVLTMSPGCPPAPDWIKTP